MYILQRTHIQSKIITINDLKIHSVIFKDLKDTLSSEMQKKHAHNEALIELILPATDKWAIIIMYTDLQYIPVTVWLPIRWVNCPSILLKGGFTPMTSSLLRHVVTSTQLLLSQGPTAVTHCQHTEHCRFINYVTVNASVCFVIEWIGVNYFIILSGTDMTQI